MKPAVALNFDLHKNTRFENKVKWRVNSDNPA